MYLLCGRKVPMFLMIMLTTGTDEAGEKISLAENVAFINRSPLPSGNSMSAWFGVICTLEA